MIIIQVYIVTVKSGDNRLWEMLYLNMGNVISECVSTSNFKGC